MSAAFDSAFEVILAAHEARAARSVSKPRRVKPLTRWAQIQLDTIDDLVDFASIRDISVKRGIGLTAARFRLNAAQENFRLEHRIIKPGPRGGSPTTEWRLKRG